MILKSKYLNLALSGLFHLILAILIYYSYEPIQLKPLDIQLRDLFTGSRNSYITPGSQLSPIKKILPNEGAITLLTDHPYKQVTSETELAHDFQNYVCPLLLNSLPVEKTGIIYTESDEIAQKRLGEEGYQMIAQWDKGKGVIVKKS